MKIKNVVIIICSVILLSLSSRDYVHAAGVTHTVCASGCEFTSIAAAFGMDGHATTVVAGDIVKLEETYNPTTEEFANGGRDGLYFPANDITLDCAGNTLGYPASDVLYIKTSHKNTTIQNCYITNVFFTLPLGSNASGIHILNNTFATDTPTSIDFGAYYIGDPTIDSFSNNFVISGNKNINMFSPNNSDGGIVDDNTFFAHAIGQIHLNGGIFIGFQETISNMVVTNNTFYNSGPDFASLLIGGRNFLFANNKVIFSTQLEHGIAIPMMVTQGFDTTIRNNIFDFSQINQDFGVFSVSVLYATTSLENMGGERYLPSWVTSGEPIVSRLNIDHNTVVCGSNCKNMAFLAVSDTSEHANNNFIFVTSTNNIVYNASNNSSYLLQALKYNPTGSISIYEDNNGIYGFTDFGRSHGGTYPTTITSGGHDIFANPFFKTTGTGQSSDYELAPFSPYLSINTSSEYIGAVPGIRRNTIHINANVPVDYTTNDAQDVKDISLYIRNGDTVQIAPGTYSALNVSSTASLQNIGIVGSGPSTIISAATPSTFSNVTGLSVSNLTFNSTVSSSAALQLNNIQNSRVNAVQISGVTASEPGLLFTSAPYRLNAVSYASDAPILIYPNGQPMSLRTNPANVIGLFGNTTPDIHMALVSIPSENFYVTIFVLDNAFHDQASLESVLASNFGAHVDAWYGGVLIASNGIYSYHPPAGVSLVSGYVTPSISKLYNAPASLEILNSNNNILNALTITNASGGLLFSGTSYNNIVSSSVFSNSAYDLRTNSTQDNTIAYSTFDKNKIAQLNTGKLNFVPNIQTTTPSPTYITKDMQIGTNDPEVLVLHALLEYLLYKPYQPRTTLYNVTTSLWVDQFKLHYHLPTNGKIAAPARTILNQEIDNRQAIVNAHEPYTFTKNLGPGWAGLEVLHLQMKLKDMGYYSGVMDGVLDTSTQQALKKMQTDYKVTNDGVVRQTTMNILNAPAR